MLVQMVQYLGSHFVEVDCWRCLVSYQVAAEAAPFALPGADSLLVHPKEHKHHLIC